MSAGPSLLVRVWKVGHACLINLKVKGDELGMIRETLRKSRKGWVWKETSITKSPCQGTSQS